MGLGRPSPLTFRWNEILVPRSWNSNVGSPITPRVEFKGSQTTAQKLIDEDQTRKEQGTWPTKMMISMWVENETNLVTMIDLLNEKAAFKIHGQNVKARLEVSPQRRPLTKAHALFFEGLKEMKEMSLK